MPGVSSENVCTGPAPVLRVSNRTVITPWPAPWIQPCVRVLADGSRRFPQLVQGGQVFGEGGFGADLLGGGVLRHGPIIDAAGEPVQRGPDGRAEDVGGLRVGQRRKLSDGFDAEPMQLLLGDGSDPP